MKGHVIILSAEKIIKLQARDKLKSGWLKAISALMIMLMFVLAYSSIVSIVGYAIYILKNNGFVTSVYNEYRLIYYGIKVMYYVLTFVLFIFTYAPVIAGFIRMFYIAFRDNSDYDLNDVFYYFSSFKRLTKSVGIFVGFFLRMIIPFYLCFLPVGIFYSLYKSFGGNETDTLFKVVVVLLSILSAVILVFYMVRYLCVYLLFCDCETMKTGIYFRESKRIVNYYSKSVTRLVWSFAPWIFFSIITVLPMLYALPYITQSMCVSGKWIIETVRNGQAYEQL